MHGVVARGRGRGPGASCYDWRRPAFQALVCFDELGALSLQSAVRRIKRA